MTSLKLQGVLVITTLVLFFLVPIETVVVNDITECSEFFLKGNPPHIPGILEHGRILDQNRYKIVCQNFTDATRTFVTFYDTKNKIPVFSAAIYKGYTGRRPNSPWHIEPELPNQAQLMDYKQDPVIYDKGHLLPSCYGHTEIMKKSTFSLTNIVPQVGTFNKGSWNRMEQCVKCVMDKYCKDNNDETEAFVVIGEQPSNGKLLNQKINIPSKLWSAFCCYSRSQNRWLASAHWGENIPDDTNDKYLQTKTLAELYSELGGQFNAFPGRQCPLRTTVSEFYPKLRKECKCPPPDPRTTAPPTTTPVTMTSNPSTLHTSTSGLSTSSASQPTTTTNPLTTTTAPATTPETTAPTTTDPITVTTTTLPEKSTTSHLVTTNQQSSTTPLAPVKNPATNQNPDIPYDFLPLHKCFGPDCFDKIQILCDLLQAYPHFRKFSRFNRLLPICEELANVDKC